jgi:hypothetical protein
LTPAYGLFGSFALDQEGKFAVVQGSAWFLKNGDDNLLRAYLALFNSYEFESLLQLLCPKMGGGQYRLYEAQMKSIPLPDLSKIDVEITRQLSSEGQSIFAGEGIRPDVLSELVPRAYGLTAKKWRALFAPGEIGSLQLIFDQLTDQWHRTTRHKSRIRDIVNAPAYQQIIDLGSRVVPMILRQLRRRPDHWFDALLEIVEEEVVIPQGERAKLSAAADAWLRWGRTNHRF